MVRNEFDSMMEARWERESENARENLAFYIIDVRDREADMMANRAEEEADDEAREELFDYYANL